MALVLLNDPAGEDDGLLQPQEIGQFRLNAGVVVLSACDTAVGPTLGQEGVLNIARAFLLADARSVITTLWAVSDVTSPSTSIVPSAGPYGTSALRSLEHSPTDSVQL